MGETLRLLFTALMVMSSIAAIGGNLVLLLVLLVNKDLWADTLGLTLSFSLSDLVLALSAIPFGVHNSLVQPNGFPSTGYMCQGTGFLLLLLQTSSIHSLTWATVDKFTEMCFALSYHRIWTAGRCRVVLVLVWSFSLGSAVLPLLGFGSYAYSESRFLCCPSFTPNNRYFVVLWTLVGIMAPILTVCSLYGYIISVARKQARRGTFRCNELHCFYIPANNYLRSAAAMVTISVTLLVCWLPHTSVCLYETLSNQQVPTGVSTFSIWLVLTSTALNPWITCMTQGRYRAALWRSLSKLTHPCLDKPPENRPQSSDHHPDHHSTDNPGSRMTTYPPGPLRTTSIPL